ncbi:MAG: transcriptional repressor [Duncaniella sp.]|nr:transcriptional repressor [Duncaniella sp.]MDE7145298.1 transcriptional repressor [Duncaniella sp.]
MKVYSYTTSDLLEQLSAHGVKPSAQRLLILRFLMENRVHPNVDEIYQALLPEHPTLSRTTVYNTLKLLTAAGIIRCIDVGGSYGARWDFSHHDHAHFLCMSCGRVTDIDFENHTPSFPLPPGGFEVQATEVNLRGMCPECLHRRQAN